MAVYSSIHCCSQGEVMHYSKGQKLLAQSAFDLQENQMKLRGIFPAENTRIIHQSAFDTVCWRLL